MISKHPYKKFMSLFFNIISTSINNFEKIDNFNEIVDNEKNLFNVAKDKLKIKEYFPGFFVTVGKKV